MKKKKKIGILSGICLIVLVVSGLLIIRHIKRVAEAEEVTEAFLQELKSDKTIIVKEYLEEQGIEAEVLWSSLEVQNNNAYILYEYKPDEDYAKEHYLGVEDAFEDYDYLGYLKLKRTFQKGMLKYYKVTEAKETLASEEVACSEGYGYSGYSSAQDAMKVSKPDWYDGGEFLFFTKAYTDEVAEIEFYDDALLKATYHAEDKGYLFIVLQNVRKVKVRFYNKEHDLIGEWDYTHDFGGDPFQDYSTIEKGRVDEWKNKK